jgi:hypothetical protein
MRVASEQFRRLDAVAHAILKDVPLRDVSVVDLPGGAAGLTLADVQAMTRRSERSAGNGMVRALFGLRRALGRLFGWDGDRHAHPEASYLERVPREIRARSVVPPGSADGAFRVLYMLERESLAEIRNATVHAFLVNVLTESSRGYRLYWAVYVAPVSWITPLYMALIEPFRRFIVYPGLLRGLRRAWEHGEAARRAASG